MFRPKPAVSLANQIKYGLALLTAVSLLLTGGILISLSYRAQQQQLQVSLQERSRATAVEIDAYLEDMQSTLGYLARVRGLMGLAPEVQHSLLEGLIRHNRAYEAAAIVDRTGRVVTTASLYAPASWDNLAASPLFLRAFKQEEDAIGSVELDPATQLPATTLAVPIRDQQDQVAGVLLARINLKFLWFIVSQVKVGEAGYAYVIDNHYFLIAEKGSAPENFQLADVSDRSFLLDLASAKGTMKTYRGLRGSEVLGTMASIRSVYWNVVVELPVAEAYAPVRNMLFVTGAALIVGMAIAIGAGFVFSRRVVRPLQRLTDAAVQMSGGNMEVRVKVEGRNELGLLAAAFNEMAAQLKELYTTLEQRVADRTRELDQAYQDLKANHAQLMIAEKMASLGRLTAGIAHEMNTPLAAVRAALVELNQLTQEYESSIGDPQVTPDDHRQIAQEMRQSFRIADKAMERAAGFVRGIKSQTRDLASHERQRFNAVPVIQETLLLLSHALRQGRTVATFEPAASDVELYGSPTRLAQVVTNLVTNAIEASVEQGGPITLYLTPQDGGVALRVSDEGCGIPPEHLPRIFDPMFTTKPFGQGTGLGLTIVHDIVVSDFYGTIQVESEPDHGTTFTLHFPYPQEQSRGA